MCGIAGAFIYDAAQAQLDVLVGAVAASASRGEDAFGVVRWSPSTGFRRYARHGRGGAEWLDELGRPGADELTVYLHTSRAEPTTEWRSEKRLNDVPPFVDHGIAVAHNGIIANDDALAKTYDLARTSTIDTAVVPPLVARLGVWEAIAALRGGSAMAVFDARAERLVLCRNFLPLSVAWQPGAVVFASEAAFFPGVDRPFKSFQTWDLPSFSCLEVSADGIRGPVAWGGSGAPADAAWEPFPPLCWRPHG